MKRSNSEMAKHEPVFKTSCFLAGIPPTPRQASKFRRGKGVARKHLSEAVELVQEGKVKEGEDGEIILSNS